MKASKIVTFIFFITMAFCFPLNGCAANENIFIYGDKPTLSFFYAITACVSLLMIILYGLIFRKKDLWVFLLYVSIFVVNLGYFSVSVSKNLEAALLANRISYLGSVFLPLCMLMTIFEACRLNVRKSITGTLIAVSVVVFLIAASPGYLDVYYKEVSLEIFNGAARLVKVYGELHIVYYIYLFAYFSSMLAVILYAVIKKKINSYKYASVLASVVFMNILIWLFEQIFKSDFEFLSVSYIAGEFLLFFFFGILSDYRALEKKTEESVSVIQNLNVKTVQGADNLTQENDNKELTVESIDALVESWKERYNLTARETEVIKLMLLNIKRKEIAEQLCLSENTVKTHFSHIFEKMNVSGKSEMIERAKSESEELVNSVG